MSNPQGTTLLTPQTAKRDWWLVDLEGKTLGRIATQIADILRGKNKPTYTPHVDGGDFVVAINAEKVALSGKKWTDKKYYYHTGYPGRIQEDTAGRLRDVHPETLITKAVKGMLPRNYLSLKLMKKLKVYTGKEHPHKAQNLKTFEDKNGN